MNIVVNDYLWTEQFTDIDNKKLYETCLMVERALLSFLPYEEGDYGCTTSYYHRAYNLFSFPCTELQKLHTNVSQVMTKLVNEQFYVRCWVNLFKHSKNINWHSHFEPEFNAYHGFYCVNTEDIPSYTEYNIPGHEIVKVDSKDGLLVLGKSAGDKHRSSVWNHPDKYRITIAFDAIPVNKLRPRVDFDGLIMHNFIPLAKC